MMFHESLSDFPPHKFFTNSSLISPMVRRAQYNKSLNG